MTTDYRAILTEVPEAFVNASHSVVPSNNACGERVSTSRDDYDSTDLHLDIVQEMVDLITEADGAATLLLSQWADVPPVTSGEARPAAPPVVGNETAAFVKVQPHLARLHENVEEAAILPGSHIVTDPLDKVAKLIKRVHRDLKKAHPRICEVCFARAVYADTQHESGVCDACNHVMRGDVWLTQQEVADKLDVSLRTVQLWVKGDKVPHKTIGKVTLVELHASREHHEFAALRGKLNLQLSKKRA